MKLARHLDNPLSPRSLIYPCGPNPVDCGGGYCCDMYQVCGPLPGGLYQCLDVGFTATNADGSTLTMTAQNPHSWNVWESSMAAEESSWGATLSYESYAELTTPGSSNPTATSTPAVSSPKIASSPTITTSARNTSAPIVVPASTTSSRSSGERQMDVFGCKRTMVLELVVLYSLMAWL